MTALRPESPDADLLMVGGALRTAWDCMCGRLGLGGISGCGSVMGIPGRGGGIPGGGPGGIPILGGNCPNIGGGPAGGGGGTLMSGGAAPAACCCTTPGGGGPGGGPGGTRASWKGEGAA